MSSQTKTEPNVDIAALLRYPPIAFPLVGILLVVAILFLIPMLKGKQETQEFLTAKRTAMAQWSAWEEWSRNNCEITGERDIPGQAGPTQMVRYSCKRGVEIEIPLSELQRAKDCGSESERRCILPVAPKLWKTFASKEE